MANSSTSNNRSRGSKNAKNSVRCNDRIQVSEVRLIDADGRMVGVVPIAEARATARRSGLDLIEISPNATPPVCRILDFGKYQYESTKKQKERKSNATKIKEVKFRFCTDVHDYETKLRHIIEFLGGGDKVKVAVFFRGRELGQTQLGFDLVKKLTLDLTTYAVPDCEAKLMGHNIFVTYSPSKKNKTKLQEKSIANNLDLEGILKI
jgi:translation initiation factor IF-3